MSPQRRQFRALFPSFLFRLVDLEVLSPDGDIQKLLIQGTALLGAVSFVIAVLLVPRYGVSPLPHQRLMQNAWIDQEFLIATTMLAAGLFMAAAWNSILPDRVDSQVLGPLPVRAETIVLAKAAAASAAVCLIVLALNFFTGLGYTFVLPSSSGLLGVLRAFAACFVTMLAAGFFVASVLVALQGAMALLLPYRMFARISAAMQVVTFFGLLAGYFLRPVFATPDALQAAAGQRWLAAVPSYWFLGLFQELNGPMSPVFGRLGGLAFTAFCISLSAAVLLFTTSYHKLSSGIIESPQIEPLRWMRALRGLEELLPAWLFRTRVEKAVVLFAARTIARSRQHRLILAAYLGTGFAFMLVYASALSKQAVDVRHANYSMAAGSLVFLFFAVIGVRALFTYPMSPRANWVFRVTMVHTPAAYHRAARSALYLFSVVPVTATAAVTFLSLWPAGTALAHVLVLWLTGTIMVESSLHRFRKIPFACTYLPGKANIHVALGAYAFAFLFCADAGVRIELWAMQKPVRFFGFAAVLGAAALRAWRRRAEFSAGAGSPIQFEDVAPSAVPTLGLEGGAWIEDGSYLDTVDRSPSAASASLR